MSHMRTTYTETFTRVERVVDAVRGLCKEHGFGFGKMDAESLRNCATNDPEALPIWVVTSEPQVITEDWEPTENGDWGVGRYYLLRKSFRGSGGPGIPAG